MSTANVEALEAEIQRLDIVRQQADAVVESLSALSLPSSRPLLAQIGPWGLVPARLVPASRPIVHIGADIYAEMSHDSAVALLKRRSSEFRSRQVSVQMMLDAAAPRPPEAPSAADSDSASDRASRPDPMMPPSHDVIPLPSAAAPPVQSRASASDAALSAPESSAAPDAFGGAILEHGDWSDDSSTGEIDSGVD
jgi:prefoldin alpha subunit